MLKERLVILLLVLYIVPLRAEETSFELGLFQELIYKYLPDNCSHTCWDMYNDGLCGIHPYTSGVFCDGQMMACEKMGRVTFIDAMEGGPRKILAVSTMKDDLSYVRYQSPGDYHNEYGTFTYSPYSHEEAFKYRACNCRCFRNYLRIYVGPLQSSENDNYVIVGIRLKLQDDVLFLQIAVGILEANGVISEFTWVPPAYNPSNYHSVDLDSRIFFLDELKLDPGYVLTGVKFEFMEAVYGGSLWNLWNPKRVKGFTISISGVPFDYETGKLDLKPENRRIVKADPSTVRKELKYKLVNPVIRGRIDEIAPGPYKPSSTAYNYVKLQQSELESDFGQTTLPLFDSRPIMMSPLSPLAGIGIFHNSTKNNAGFISLRLSPIN